MNKRLLLTFLITGTLALATDLRAQTALPSVQILATDPVALEGTSSGSFTLIRNGDTNEDLEVDLDISGSASNDVDYLLIAGANIIPAGYLAVDIPVQPIVDTTTRGNKTVTLTILSNANYTISRKGRATVTIVDDVFNNPLPTVTITDPTNGSSLMFPAAITITADANDDGADIQSVSFYADDEFLGRVTNSPYTLTWAGARPGHHNLFARAVDTLEQSSVSPTVQIAVIDVLPVVTLTTPGNGDSFAAHQNIPIAATVTDANSSATITGVAFYSNGQLLGTSTSAPYQIVWSNAPSGPAIIEAVATDNAGQRGYSKMVKINFPRSNR